MRVLAFPDPDHFATGAASMIAEAIRRYPPDLRVNVGLAGGSTPRPVYQQLRGLPVSWERVDLWLSDERWVPPDHPDCNGRMAADVLADHLPAVLHRLRWSRDLHPSEAAASYEASLRELMRDGNPHIVLLGMGEDGHTASLFPGTTALDAPESRWVVANWVESQGAWRITVTSHLLRRTREVFVLVSGEAKAEVLREVLEGPDGAYPVQLLRRGDGDVTWLVDEAAASQLAATEVERRDGDPGIAD